jgi:solute carrier family 8 (sodium/calcium exchanger)
LELYSPEGGVKLGKVFKTVINIINDYGYYFFINFIHYHLIFNFLMKDLKNLASRIDNMVIADLEELRVVKKGFKEQFVEAFNVNEGDIENASRLDYIIHFLAFPWKVIFAFVPPPHIWGGWLCFFVSLFMIGVLTAIVGDMAAIFGCLVGLKDSVTAITYI